MFLIGTVAIAAIVGIIYALIFGLDASSIDLGSAEHSRGTEISKQAKDLTANTLPQQVLELLPSNPFLTLQVNVRHQLSQLSFCNFRRFCIFTCCTQRTRVWKSVKTRH